MKDFDKYCKELYAKTREFDAHGVLDHYRLPKTEVLHNMICGDMYVFESEELFATAESIDYLKYEKELWNINNQT